MTVIEAVPRPVIEEDELLVSSKSDELVKPMRGIGEDFGLEPVSSEVYERSELADFVDADTENFLRDAWDEYHVDNEVEASQKMKLRREGRHIKNLIALHELFANISGNPSEELKQFIATFGIANFGRYDPDKLYDQHLKWKSGNIKDFDVLMMVARYGDANGAFDNVSEPFDTEDRGNVVVFEVGEAIQDLESTLTKAREKGLHLRNFVVSGHGDIEGGIPDLGIDKDAQGIETLEEALQAISLREGSPVLILDSCLSADRVYVPESTALQISRRLKGVYVVGTSKPMQRTEVGKDGAISYSNKNADGSTTVFPIKKKFDPSTGEIWYEPGDSYTIGPRLRGSLLIPKTRVYRDGVMEYSSHKGWRANRVKSTFISR